MSLPNRARLSLCMIVRDNERTIEPCLRSVRPWVDEIVVVDTGSVDRTPEICRRYGASVTTFPWIDDFSVARNESLRLAAGDWMFWMDSDDTIDAANGQKLRNLVDGHHGSNTLAYVLQVHCPGGRPYECTVVDHVKLFRNGHGISFEGRIHEQLLGSIRALGGAVQWTDIFVVHSGSDYSPESRKRKIERDLRILKKDLEERPNHPFALFNLGMTYLDAGDHEAAVDWLRRSLAVSQPSESHVRKAYALLVAGLTALHQIDEAKRVVLAGRKLFPDDAELLFRQGIIAHEQKQFVEAIQVYRQVLQNKEERYFSSRESGINGFMTRHNLAVIYEELGHPLLAEIEWRRALRSAPNFAPAAFGLIRGLRQRGRHASADVEWENLQGRGLNSADIRYLMAERHYAEGQLDMATRLLEEILHDDQTHVESLRLLARVHFDKEEWAGAERVLRRIVEVCPTDAATWHNLGMVHTHLGDTGAATRALEESLKLRPGSESTRAMLIQITQSTTQFDACNSSFASNVQRIG